MGDLEPAAALQLRAAPGGPQRAAALRPQAPRAAQAGHDRGGRGQPGERTLMAATTPQVTAGAHGPTQKGMDTALMGMMLFIASEIMFFAGLFGAYFTFRGQAQVWPPQGFEVEPFPLPAILTVILVTSSFTMQYAT